MRPLIIESNFFLDFDMRITGSVFIIIEAVYRSIGLAWGKTRVVIDIDCNRVGACGNLRLLDDLQIVTGGLKWSGRRGAFIWLQHIFRLLEHSSANSLRVSLWLHLERKKPVLECVAIVSWFTGLNFKVANAVEPILDVVYLIATINSVVIVLEQWLNVVFIWIPVVVRRCMIYFIDVFEITGRNRLATVSVQELIGQGLTAIDLFVLDLLQQMVVFFTEAKLVLDQLIN